MSSHPCCGIQCSDTFENRPRAEDITSQAAREGVQLGRQLLTQTDDSRQVVRALLVPRESSWTHLSMVRQAVERYGRPLASSVDNRLIYPHQSYRATMTTAEADARVQCRLALRRLAIGIL
jgi:hypothetical protein